MDEVIEMKDNVLCGPISSRDFERKSQHEHLHKILTVMVAPIRCPDVVCGKAHPLPPGLQVLHAYTMLTAGSKQVSIVVQNMMDSAIFLKKGVHVVHVVSAMLVPPEEVPSEQAEGMQAPRE